MLVEEGAEERRAVKLEVSFAVPRACSNTSADEMIQRRIATTSGFLSNISG